MKIFSISFLHLSEHFTPFLASDVAPSELHVCSTLEGMHPALNAL